MHEQGKRDIIEKTYRPAAFSGTILTCENPGAALLGIEIGSPRCPLGSLWSLIVTRGDRTPGANESDDHCNSGYFRSRSNVMDQGSKVNYFQDGGWVTSQHGVSYGSDSGVDVDVPHAYLTPITEHMSVVLAALACGKVAAVATPLLRTVGESIAPQKGGEACNNVKHDRTVQAQQSRKLRCQVLRCAVLFLRLRAQEKEQGATNCPDRKYAHCPHAVQWPDYSPLTKANKVRFPAGLLPDNSHVGIVQYDAAGGQVFLGMSRFPRPSIPVLLHTHLVSPSSSLKTSRVDIFHQFLTKSSYVHAIACVDHRQRSSDPRATVTSLSVQKSMDFFMILPPWYDNITLKMSLLAVALRSRPSLTAIIWPRGGSFSEKATFVNCSRASVVKVYREWAMAPLGITTLGTGELHAPLMSEMRSSSTIMHLATQLLSVRMWLEEHCQDFKVLPWSPNSPDFNPIENLWNHLDRYVRRLSPPPRSLQQLWDLLEATYQGRAIKTRQFQEFGTDENLLVGDETNHIIREKRALYRIERENTRH
ncbi:hypothetical protein PR048_011474 [Dryococelus australis]|uniref:Tc1-like transposase DDE domain-containing protein n=1 Tax=Dryococelus australis TaxID=614101 RepID=A0ABQ9HM08_9NEOP|nr:hypothetical protein PR048_011474 [Dryococelus australis]